MGLNLRSRPTTAHARPGFCSGRPSGRPLARSRGAARAFPDDARIHHRPISVRGDPFGIGDPSGTGDAGGMGDAGGIADGGGITERAGGIDDGAVGAFAAMAGLLAFVVMTGYHLFMNSISGNSPQTSPGATNWDFLTNHAHVVTCVAHDPGIRLRDIAAAVGITERAAHRILSELVEDGYVLREREGRRNHYQVVADLPLRHPLVRGREVGDLLKVLIGAAGPEILSQRA
jgi:DNA-binding transcriptional ArsR family regulator